MLRVRVLLLLASLIFSLTSRAAAAEDPQKPPEVDIRPVAQEAWGNSPEQVRGILGSAAGELFRHFPKRSLKPIVVEPSGGPIALYKRGAQGEYQVRLDTGDNLWSQWTYQFAHEFGHILSNYDEVKHQNKWFEETVCEVASLFVLRRMADTWSKDPSPASWKRYAPHLRKYAEERIEKAKLPDGMSLPQWYETNARPLARDGCDRERNTLLAVQLLPLFEEAPEHWEAITWLAKAKTGHSGSFAEFLKAWQTQCPEKHHTFVAGIAAKFAIDLDKVTLAEREK